MHNKFSNKNSLIYKMKFINSRNEEYFNNSETKYDRIEKYNDITKK